MKSPFSNPKLRKRTLWLGSIAAVVALVLAALPMVTARIATSWLQDNGAPNARIENVDINLFTGTVRIIGLEAGGDSQQRLHIGLAEVDIRWWPLVSKRLLVEAVRLSDTQIDVSPDDGSWQVGGLRISPAATEAEPAPEEAATFDWGIGSETIALNNVSLTYRDPVFDTGVEIREIAIGSHFSWQAGEETDLVIDMDVNGSPINLRSTLVPWGEEQSISGNLQASDYALAEHGEALLALAGLDDVRGTINLDLTATATLNENGVIDLLVTGPLDISGINFTRDALTFSNGQLDWQGQLDLTFPVSGDEPFMLLDGTLQLADTRVALADQELAAELGGLDYSGRLELSNGNDSAATGMTLAATLAGQGVAVDHTRLPFALARLDSVSLSDIQVSDLQQASIGQLQIQGLQLLANETADESIAEQTDTPPETASENSALFSVGQLDVEQISYESPTRVVVDSVALDEPALSVVRKADGSIERLSEMLAVFAGEPGQEAEVIDDAPEADAPFTVAVNNVQVQAARLLDFEDQSVMPQFNYQLSTLDLAIDNIDTGSTNPMAVRLATGNDTMQLNAEGSIAAFSDPLSVSLMANVAALELPRFSPYIPGYNIDRGRLNLESTISLEGEALDLQNSVVLESIRLAGKAAEDNEILAQGMAMPLDAALDLLRDSEDRIALDLPVTGSLSDPRFDSADIIRTVMQNALQNAAMSYVTNALQPLGTILLVRDLATRAAAPSFAPLELTAGDPTLSPENREYLFKIGELLVERPSLQLSFCGIATQTDREALRQRAQEAALADAADEGANVTTEEPAPAESAAPIPPQVSDGELLQLAAGRTDAAIAFMVDEVMIGNERLFACRETIDEAPDGNPRVRVSL